MKINTKHQLIKLSMAALCLAMCLILPSITGGIPYIGNLISPMHIPVFLCGFLCGPVWGFAVGLTAPILRYFIFQAPMLPIAIPMMGELAVYGLSCALFYKFLPKKNINIYTSLIAAMIIGRFAGIGVKYVLFGIGYIEKTALSVLLESYFVTALPGIAIHLLLIPAILFALKQAKIFPLKQN